VDEPPLDRHTVDDIIRFLMQIARLEELLWQYDEEEDDDDDEPDA
jgi:hypothetical protein